MKKRSFLVALLALFLVPFGVNAESREVSSIEELKTALDDQAVTEIVLGADIETLGKINVTRNVTIDGNGHAITYVGKFFATVDDAVGSDDKGIWSKKSSDGTSGAVYVMQVYMAEVTLKNISLNGGNRGLAINGGTVTLDGSVMFANNGFQPMELGTGGGVPAGTESVLIVTNDAWVVNLDNNETYPYTLYVDTDNGKLVRGSNEKESLTRDANLVDDEINVNLVKSVEDGTEVPSDVFEQIKNSNQNLVLVKFDENADDAHIVYGWEFSNGITDSSIALNTDITLTKEAPATISDEVSKLVANYQNLNYLNFGHHGSLPGKATVMYDVSSVYASGTKLYVAHFNETTKQLEKEVEVTVNEEGYIEFEITECSSYVLYTGIEAPSTATSTSTVANAKTGDIPLLMMISFIAVAAIGFVVTSKKIVAKVK